MFDITPVITEEFTLPDGALCFSANGWVPDPFMVLIELQGASSLQEVLNHLWIQHQGILGVGTLGFSYLELEPKPKGYIVFTPEDDEEAS